MMFRIFNFIKSERAGPVFADINIKGFTTNSKRESFPAIRTTEFIIGS